MSASILIVDDNPDNLVLTEILLVRDGFTVHLAEDAAQTLDLLATLRPDLILMDIQLPGMDGLELTRQLRGRTALEGVPIVALSAYAMTGDKENAGAAGCVGYITKPINTRTFAAEVRGFLHPQAPPIAN